MISILGQCKLLLIWLKQGPAVNSQFLNQTLHLGLDNDENKNPHDSPNGTSSYSQYKLK